MKPFRDVGTGRPATLLAVLLLLALAAVLAPAALSAGDGAAAAPALQDDEADEPLDAEAGEWTAAEMIGPEVCSACHEEVVEAFGGPHATLFAEGGGCGSCHGPASEHVDSGGEVSMFTFGHGDGTGTGAGMLREAKTCLQCHGDEHPRFAASPHAAAGVGCASCHSIHEPAAESPALLAPVRSVERPMDRLDTVSRTCEGCHGAVFTQFDFNEGHKLRQGVLSCGSCHDPHAPTRRVRLAGFQRDTCLECHTDKAGPFVFEHGSSLVEGCVACHTPHGSPNRHMLNTQRVAESCYSCHPGVPGFHARFTLDTVCTNCHSQIHGSNLHPAFLE